MFSEMNLNLSEKTLNRIDNYSTVAMTLALIAAAAVHHTWEYCQAERTISDVELISIRPYSISSEVGWSWRGNYVKVEGEELSIKFPGNLDDTLRPGDTVDVVVRESFPRYLGIEHLDGRLIREIDY